MHARTSGIARRFCGALGAAALTVAAAASAGAVTVFSTGFESGLPAPFAAPGSQIEGVQGYAGLGVAGNQFAGNLLRYHATGVQPTTLTLTNLPAHTHVSLSFLLAVIDSWDGTELLQVSVDGNLVFSHWFSLANADTSSYSPPPGALLSRGHNLGWTNGTWYFRDRAYDLTNEPVFASIPHTAGTLTVVWQLSATVGGAAQNWQGGADESWGIDNVTVSLAGAPTDTPPSAEHTSLVLRGAAPNPFNPTTQLFYDVPAGGADVSLRIYDLGGRLVRTLVNGPQAGGSRTAMWDGRSDAGVAARTGMYVCRLTGAGRDSACKITLVK